MVPKDDIFVCGVTVIVDSPLWVLMVVGEQFYIHLHLNG